ncbi:MAG: hypothetical protein NC930_00505 [Candidatus Omnitrophica bacterium]|nr:hypothetical protein [Candidatus Omnitrophota bacterium]
MIEKKKLRIFTVEQINPCGPGSSCCGPVGQTKDEIAALKTAVEAETGSEVEICDLGKMKDFKAYPQVWKVLNAFGTRAIPVVTAGDEVVCMGSSDIDEIVSAIKGKIWR